MPEYKPRPDDAETVCYCVGVSKGALRKAIAENGAQTVNELSRCTGALGGCMTCRWDLEALLEQEGDDLRANG